MVCGVGAGPNVATVATVRGETWVLPLVWFSPDPYYFLALALTGAIDEKGAAALAEPRQGGRK